MELINYVQPLLLEKNTINHFQGMNGIWGEKSIYSECDKITLMLIPSERCNLRCKYCYETEKNQQVMQVSLAKKIIAEYFYNLPENNILKIELRGGEPLLEFSFMKEIAEWTFNNYPQNNYCFYSVTNGTMLNDEKKEWFSKYKDKFELPLSIDGMKGTHDSNRDNSFDGIDIEYFLKTWKNAYSITTVLPENVNDLCDNILFLLNKGFTMRVNFEPAANWKEFEIMECSKQFRKLVDHIITQKIRHRLNILSCYGFIEYEEKPSQDRRYVINCNAGRNRIIYTPDGNKYPCHMMVPSAFSNFSKNGAETFKMLKNNILNPPECCECPYFYSCHLCVGFSLSYNNNLKWRNKSLCYITKIRTFTAAYYWGKRLENKLANGSFSENEKYIARKIYDLYKAEKIVS